MSTPEQKPDPLQDAINLAQRVIDDANKLLKGLTKAAHDVTVEGVDVAGDAAGIAVSSLQLAKDKLDEAAAAVGRVVKR